MKSESVTKSVRARDAAIRDDPREHVCVLGSTGSIGVSTLDVLARHSDRFRVVALTAHSNAERLLEQIRATRPEQVVMVDPRAAAELREVVAREGLGTRVDHGAEALEAVAESDAVDTVMAAIVGAAGLPPTLAAARSGKKLLLANKEALVMSGALLLDAAQASGAVILPIDSEHNAIFQCLPHGFRPGTPAAATGATRVWLTASGGPFRERPLEDFDTITPDEACAHPNWSMGRKISVDSATMMNKGLEVIEAHWLFGVSAERIEVVLHPQSMIHSMVAYADGSVLAQLGNPDMRTPIAHALAWPERMASGVEALDLLRMGALEFAEPCAQRFPCLELSYRALRAGGLAPTILNAANEVAVAAFLDGAIRFPGIAASVAATCHALDWGRLEADTGTPLDAILAADGRARDVAGTLLDRDAVALHPGARA